jgi:hypothetical protein
MEESILDKILQNSWQFALIILSSAYALGILGKGLIDFLDRMIKIISTLVQEFSGKSPARLASVFNILLLILIAVLSFMAISPSLLAQLGFVENGSLLGYHVTLIIALCFTGVWSGHFIHQFYIEGNAYKDSPLKKKQNGKASPLIKKAG